MCHVKEEERCIEGEDYPSNTWMRLSRNGASDCF